MRAFSQLLAEVAKVNKAMPKQRLTKAEKARRRLENKLNFEARGFERVHERKLLQNLPNDQWNGETQL